MINRLTMITTECTDPYRNLAFEEYLTMHAETGECILFLWQNRDTIVFGKNQNILAECRAAEFEADGGRIVRRLSGGGTVYHDLGNLNFTFAVRRGDYSVKRQSQVILEAVRKFGIDAQLSGRNDILAQGRKFSGNAFYKSGDFCYHHGTLLISCDTSRMASYLTVDPQKIRSKGVKSVKARVVNLSELCPEIDRQLLTDRLTEAFAEVYGNTVDILRMDGDNRLAEAAGGSVDVRFTEAAMRTALDRATARFASRDWNYGGRAVWDLKKKARFDWGTVEICMTTSDGIITDCRIFSDAMDQDFIEKMAAALEGCGSAAGDIRTALESCAGDDSSASGAEHTAMINDTAALATGSVPEKITEE